MPFGANHFSRLPPTRLIIPAHSLTLSCFLSAPQRFVLPIAGWESQSPKVNFWIFCEKCQHLRKHVIARRYDVEEIFDDAHIKINPECICWLVYPWFYYNVGYHWSQCVLLVPNTGMMATKISGQCHNCHP